MPMNGDVFAATLGFSTPDDRRALRATCATAHGAPSGERRVLAVRLSATTVGYLRATAASPHRWWGADRDTVCIIVLEWRCIDLPGLFADLLGAVLLLSPEVSTLYLHPLSDMGWEAVARLLRLVEEHAPSVRSVRAGVACTDARPAPLATLDPLRLVEPAVLKPWALASAPTTDGGDAACLRLLHDLWLIGAATIDDAKHTVLAGVRRVCWMPAHETIIGRGGGTITLPGYGNMRAWMTRYTPNAELLVARKHCPGCVPHLVPASVRLVVLMDVEPCSVHLEETARHGKKKRQRTRHSPVVWLWARHADAGPFGGWVPEPRLPAHRTQSAFWMPR